MTENGRIGLNDLDGGLGQGCGPALMFYFFIGAIVLMTLCGCKSIQYVPVPEYHTDSIYLTRVQFDSIWQHDSIYVREYTKGDTVYLEHTKWHTKYKEVAVHDTSYIERIDSVSVPVPVERKLSPWERTKQDYGGWAFALVILTFIYIIRKFVRKFLP